jgi:hypothetical protein
MVSGALSSVVGAKVSSCRRVKSSVFSDGVRKVAFSGRGTMRKKEVTARRIVKRPSIMKTLVLLAYQHEKFGRNNAPPPAGIASNVVHFHNGVCEELYASDSTSCRRGRGLGLPR